MSCHLLIPPQNCTQAQLQFVVSDPTIIFNDFVCNVGVVLDGEGVKVGGRVWSIS